MHYLPDTEDEDSAAEKFWPEGYKQVIREGVPPYASAQLQADPLINRFYEQQFSEKYPNAASFIDRLANMIAVGAENGADDAFNDIMDSFLYELPLPGTRNYATYLEPEVLSSETVRQLKQTIIDEYGVDDIYTNAYTVGYADRYASLEEYIDWVSRIVISGVKNGANDLLGKIYRAFMAGTPLTPARRRPRRLRTW